MPEHVAVSRHINFAFVRLSFIVAIAVLPVVKVSAQPVLGLTPSCTTADVSGTYRYAISGFSSGTVPYSDSGLLTADGEGNVTGKSNFVLGFSPRSRTISGSYSMSSDCTGTVTLSDNLGTTAHLQIALVNGGEQVNFIEVDAGASVGGTAKKQYADCSQLITFGSYSYAISGWLQGSNASLPYSALGVLSVAVSGSYSGSASVSSNGAIVSQTMSGTINVGQDCSGSATFNDNLGDSLHFSLVAASDASEINFIENDNGANIAGIATRQLASPAFGIIDTTTRAAGPISPGKIVSVIGQNLVPETMLSVPAGSNGVLPNSVAGAQVLMNGAPASIVFAEPGEICVVVPFSIAGASSVSVQVKNQLGVSNPQIVSLADAAPTIFSYGSDGAGQGFVVNNATGALNTIYNPFDLGTEVSIWGTGGGVTFPTIGDGLIYNTPLPLAGSISVYIGGLSAKVNYAGLFAGGNPGVMQINAVIPAGVQPGTAVSVQVVVGGHASQPGITMAIK